MPPRRIRVLALVGCALSASPPAPAQWRPPAPALQSQIEQKAQVEQQRQQDRERALRQRLEQGHDLRPPLPEAPAAQRLRDDETPCFRIEQLALEGEEADDFEDLLSFAGSTSADVAQDDSPIGRCLGTEGVNEIMARLQRELVRRGWVTTRVLAGPQSLADGRLVLTLVPGRVGRLRYAAPGDGIAAPQADRRLWAAFPMRSGARLQVRDIEQGLENLQHTPTQEARIRIEPSEGPQSRPGDSDLVVEFAEHRRLRATVGLDNSGTAATGRTQASATVALDDPLGLNDLFYVSLNHDAFNPGGRDTRSSTVHYDLPWGYWQVGATASNNSYLQTVPGPDFDHDYSGRGSSGELSLSRLLHRDAVRKTSLALRGFRRSSDNTIDNEAVGPQKRIVAGWELALSHRELMGAFTVDAGLSFKRGTGAFHALPAPEATHGEGDSRFGLIGATLALNAPFQVLNTRLRYGAQWRAQWHRTPMPVPERFSIGGRYSVRGFDGDQSLTGDRGWSLRQELGLPIGASGVEPFAALDMGRIGGPSSAGQGGRRLIGAGVGLRAQVGSAVLDLFAGTPISRPESLRTARWVVDASLSVSF